ncbi:MAG: transglycosylase SLT domain-containing protein [Acidiferrobacterales bacterium]
MRQGRIFIAALFLLGFAQQASAALLTEPDITRQRDDYRAALVALEAGELETFRELYQRLDGYILQGYLQYALLNDRLSSTPRETIERFLEEHDYAPISAQLRIKWLKHLAAEGDWEMFLQRYQPGIGNRELECHWLKQRHERGEDQASLAPGIEKLWLTPKRLPSACNTLFQRWEKAGLLNDELVWARIERLMQRGRLSFAKELANRYLDAKDRRWVRHWQDMHRRPAQQLEKVRYASDRGARARTIIKHGVVRLAYRDPEAAMTQWARLREKHPSLADDNDEILRRVGVIGVQRHVPEALQWLTAIENADADPLLRRWRLRAALRSGDWELAKRFVTTLTEDEQRDRFWWYWTARIMEQTNEPTKAGYLYALAARERNYYGFLAADRIGANYVMQHAPLAGRAEEIQAVRQRRDVHAARELFVIGDLINARRQWGWVIRDMSPSELEAAALVARDWGWHDRVIYTLSRAGHRDDLDLRFPVLYRDTVESNAEANNLDPSWIYGVMRQESAFVPDARSPAGALGLMQLLPSVGRATGKQLKLKIRSHEALLAVENNLRLGAAFLKKMLRRYGGHHTLATAAYNAGPSRVRAWLPQAAVIEADIWVETIPYNETRHYVKNVMAYTAVYDHRLQRPPVRLCRRMPPVAARRDDTQLLTTCPVIEALQTTSRAVVKKSPESGRRASTKTSLTLDFITSGL